MWYQRWQGVSQEILCADATRAAGRLATSSTRLEDGGVTRPCWERSEAAVGRGGRWKRVAASSSLSISLPHACNMKTPRRRESRRRPTPPLHNSRWRNALGENSSAPFGMWRRYANISLVWRWKGCGRLSVSTSDHSMANIRHLRVCVHVLRACKCVCYDAGRGYWWRHTVSPRCDLFDPWADGSSCIDYQPLVGRHYHKQWSSACWRT